MKFIKDNLSSSIIVLTFLALAVPELFSQEIQYVMALVGIFSFGILHGSNDLFVIENLSSNSKQNQFVKSLSIYLGVVLTFVAIFYFIPFIALLAFVLISGYHFGEQHFHHKISNQKSILASLFYLSYGLLVLFLLLYFNSREVIAIIEDMTSYIVPEKMLFYVLLFSMLGSLILYLILSKNNKALRASALHNLFYFILFSGLFYVSDVVWGFAVYFVLWHSLPSLKDQVNSLYGTFDLKNFYKYFKKAFPYWLASIIGMCVVVWIFKDSKNFLSLLFAFIAAITFPHVFVMRKLFDRD